MNATTTTNPTPTSGNTTLWQDLRSLPGQYWILFSGTLVNRFGHFVIPFLAIYLRQQGHDVKTTGLVMGAYGAGALVAGPAFAASVVNIGSSSVVIVVVEDGNKVEISLDAGGSDVICSSGCFLTLPNGDRIGLAGGETVEIKDGVATIK